MGTLADYIKWGFESRLKLILCAISKISYYIKWGFESRLKPFCMCYCNNHYYIKWGFESRGLIKVFMVHWTKSPISKNNANPIIK